MKSAYELAMERLGGTTAYTEEQKARFCEIDARYDARVAEENHSAEQRMASAGADTEQLREIRRQLEHELAKLEEKRAKEKEAVRDAG